MKRRAGAKGKTKIKKINTQISHLLYSRPTKICSTFRYCVSQHLVCFSRMCIWNNMQAYISELLWLCRVVALKSLPVHSFNALIIPILRDCLQSLVLRAGCGIWLYQFLIIAYLFTLHIDTLVVPVVGVYEFHLP